MSLFTKATWFVDYMKFFSGVRDVRAFSALRKGRMPTGQELELHLRRPPGTSLTCRAGTSDAEVLLDVFWGQYHLPAADLPRHPVIFDLGANVGFSCLDFGIRFPEARIVGVEMDADNVALARRNTAVLGNRSEIVHAAIWKEDSEVRYSKSAEEWGYHISSGRDGAASVVVRAMAIDTLMQEAGVDWVDYMKIDIEGAEDEILVSDARWLACTGELNIKIHAPATYEKCSEILTRSGFVCTRSTRHKNSVLARRPQPAR